MALAVTEPTAASASTTTRGDIQTLRAFAVLAVLLFHFFPGHVRGGYIGVDIFFVISGYLITGQLVRRREQGRLRLAAFWASRARRLLPLSLFVLACSAIATLLWAPELVQLQYLRSIIGSALYVENWVLAVDAVDYLAAHNAPPVAQHYWSLSVEEQFYLFWPLLVLAIPALAQRRGRRLLTFCVLALTIASFALCIWATAASPSFAYFATPVRLWEFGLGALVALARALAFPPVARVALWVTAWLVIAVTTVLYSASTPFPGFWALLPTAATAMLIALGPKPPFHAASFATSRPITWIGDQSYGIYLWHWPIVVLAPAILGQPMQLWHKLCAIALTFALAAATKRWIEDPIRFGRPAKWRPRTTLLVTASAMIVVVAVAAAPAWAIQRSTADRAAEASQEALDPAACRGAAAIWEDNCESQRAVTISVDELSPPLSGVLDDTGGAYRCYVQDEQAAFTPCTIGSEDADAPRIALTGDSHAAMFVPALDRIGKDAGFGVDVYVGRGCVWGSAAHDEACNARQSSFETALREHDYAAVLVTGWNQPDFVDSERTTIARSYADAWQRAIDSGIEVVAIRDNPNVSQAATTCLSNASSVTTVTCALNQPSAMPPDPIVEAAAIAKAPLIDLTQAYCRDGSCPVVAGGIVVYRDLHHITATFSTSLVPYITPALVQAIPALEPA